MSFFLIFSSSSAVSPNLALLIPCFLSIIVSTTSFLHLVVKLALTSKPMPRIGLAIFAIKLQTVLTACRKVLPTPQDNRLLRLVQTVILFEFWVMHLTHFCGQIPPSCLGYWHLHAACFLPGFLTPCCKQWIVIPPQIPPCLCFWPAASNEV